MTDELNASAASAVVALQAPAELTDAQLNDLSGGGAREEYEAEKAKAIEAGRRHWGILGPLFFPR